MPLPTTTSSRTPGTTSLAQRIAVVALATGLAVGGLAFGGLACSTNASDDEPRNPTDVNVDADDVLPPAEGSPDGPGVEVDGINDEGM